MIDWLGYKVGIMERKKIINEIHINWERNGEILKEEYDSYSLVREKRKLDDEAKVIFPPHQNVISLVPVR